MGNNWCCDDVWTLPKVVVHQDPTGDHSKESKELIPKLPVEYSRAFGKQKFMLLNSARGLMLNLKMAQYSFELLATICGILSYLTIWAYCTERQIVLKGCIQTAHPAYKILFTR